MAISTRTLQNIVDDVKPFIDITATMNVGGYSARPALMAATDVMNAICGVAFPHKWNEILIPPFYTNSFQQDYAVPGVTNLAWLERGIVLDINNTSLPKPYRNVECGRQLGQATGSYYNTATESPLFLVNFFPNANLYYGTWGAGNTGSASFGNNPTSGSVYTNPVGASVTMASWSSNAGGEVYFALTYIPNNVTIGSTLTVTGAFPATYNGSWTVTNLVGLNVVVAMASNPGFYQTGGVIGQQANLVMPVNPITQIIDENGNLLVLTQYGTEGIAAPTAPPGAPVGTTCSGTGATTTWTVVDPSGQGFRILPVPSSTGVVWQFNLVGQAIPVRFTSMNQLLTPLPDQFEPDFRAGFIAQCYRYSSFKEVREKFKEEWQMWLASLSNLRSKQDRELEENMFIPQRGIMGRRSGGGQTPAWPFNGPSWGG